MSFQRSINKEIFIPHLKERHYCRGEFCIAVGGTAAVTNTPGHFLKTSNYSEHEKQKYSFN